MRGRDIWVFIFAGGVVFLNWPFLGIFRDSLPSYLFSMWAALIGAAGIISYIARKRSEP